MVFHFRRNSKRTMSSNKPWRWLLPSISSSSSSSSSSDNDVHKYKYNCCYQYCYYNHQHYYERQRKRMENKIMDMYMDSGSSTTRLRLDKPIGMLMSRKTLFTCKRKFVQLFLETLLMGELSQYIMVVEIHAAFIDSLCTNNNRRELYSIIGNFPNLHHISFHGSYIDGAFLRFLNLPFIDFAIIVHAAKRLQSILVYSDVEVSGTRYDLYKFTNALTHHTSLQIFAWHGHCNITQQQQQDHNNNINNNNNNNTIFPHYEPIAQALSTCTNLQCVSLAVPLDPFDPNRKGPDIAPITIYKLIQAVQTEIRLWTEHWDAVAHAVAYHPTLETLYLKKMNNVNITDCQALGQYLFATNKSLHQIKLSIGTSELSPEMVQYLAEGMSKTRTIGRRHVDICGKAPILQSRASSSLLVHALEQNQQLTIKFTTPPRSVYATTFAGGINNNNMIIIAPNDTGNETDTDNMMKIPIQSKLNEVGHLLIPNNPTKLVRAINTLIFDNNTNNNDSYDDRLLTLNCLYKIVRENPMTLCCHQNNS